MKKFAILVAGGSGSRMQNVIPKQFLLLQKKPVLFHTMLSFAKADASINIIIVLPKDYIEYWKKLCGEYEINIDHTLVEGGETRFHSVKNGLEKTGDEGLVAVHDAVRPLIDSDFVNSLFKHAEKYGNAAPVIPLSETIRIIDGENSKTADRNKFRIVQTPQVFDVQKIRKAYEQNYSEAFTDDASVMEAAGEKIYLTAGNPSNIKITTPADLIIAEGILYRNNSDFLNSKS
jgi:2-C-methyl-D-erythritol 4-phosphate cytidylyltransferase